jgi:hypothetical protein
MRPAAGTALLAVAGTLAEAMAAAAAGATSVDLGRAERAEQAERAERAEQAVQAAITALRASHPGLLICAASEQADMVRDPAMALRTGAILICDGLARAELAVASAGLARGQLLVETEPGGVSRARAAGFAVLVDLRDGPAAAAAPGAAASGAPPGALAIAAICAWLGATMVRTSHPPQVRRALDMADSIRGGRPPARTVRGLA